MCQVAECVCVHVAEYVCAASQTCHVMSDRDMAEKSVKRANATLRTNGHKSNTKHDIEIKIAL